MRFYEQEDPKTPRPVARRYKGDGALETEEHDPHELGPRRGYKHDDDGHRPV